MSPDKKSGLNNTRMSPNEQMFVTKIKTQSNGTATAMEKTKRTKDQQKSSNHTPLMLCTNPNIYSALNRFPISVKRKVFANRLVRCPKVGFPLLARRFCSGNFKVGLLISCKLTWRVRSQTYEFDPERVCFIVREATAALHLQSVRGCQSQ